MRSPGLDGKVEGWDKANMSVGELFILGFFGKAVPEWLRQFADRYGLGGIIVPFIGIKAIDLVITALRLA